MAVLSFLKPDEPVVLTLQALSYVRPAPYITFVFDVCAK
jgi:hypothetical protein